MPYARTPKIHKGRIYVISPLPLDSHISRIRVRNSNLRNAEVTREDTPLGISYEFFLPSHYNLYALRLTQRREMMQIEEEEFSCLTEEVSLDFASTRRYGIEGLIRTFTREAGLSFAIYQPNITEILYAFFNSLTLPLHLRSSYVGPLEINAWLDSLLKRKLMPKNIEDAIRKDLIKHPQENRADLAQRSGFR